MSRTFKDNQRKKTGSKQRHVSVRAVRRDPPDLRKLSQALIQLALQQAADEAAAKQQAERSDDLNSEQSDE